MTDFTKCGFMWQGELIPHSLEELNKMTPEIKKMKMIDAILAAEYPKFLISENDNKNNTTDCCPFGWTNVDEYLYQAPEGMDFKEAALSLQSMGMTDLLVQYGAK